MARWKSFLFIFFGLAFLLIFFLAGLVTYAITMNEPVTPTPIERHLSDNIKPFIGKPATATPIPITPPTPHPFMAAQGVNSMHSDSYNSDVHSNGPLGINPKINTRKGSWLPAGECATVTFNSQGNLIALCASFTGFRLHLLEARTLKLLAEHKLAIRPSTYDTLLTGDKSHIMTDTSGAYFYLDNKDRIVMATSDQHIRRIAHKQKSDGSWFFTNEDSWDLTRHVPFNCTSPTNWKPQGECDPITAVMPDYQGLLWWVTRHGRVGTLNTKNGKVQMIQLAGEEIQNGFAVATDGVYIVSDHKMYRFAANDVGQPQIGWQYTYDRGTTTKVGAINQGSGTTPTLMGDRFVTFTDNADGQMNLIVLQRQQSYQGNRTVCKIPLFTAGHSITDNSMIAFNRSIILENNAGYHNAFDQQDWHNAGGGISRIDINPDDKGCHIVWTSKEKSPSVVPKLSAKTGLAYFYTYELQDDEKVAWYFTALDYQTGKTQFKILIGTGPGVDNNWAPITLAPDGTAYVGTLKGIIALWDNPKK